MKISKALSSRNPFLKDESVIDYEADSEEEWGEEAADDVGSDDEEEEQPRHTFNDDDSELREEGFIVVNGESSEQYDSDPETNHGNRGTRLDLLKGMIERQERILKLSLRGEYQPFVHTFQNDDLSSFKAVCFNQKINKLSS